MDTKEKIVEKALEMYNEQGVEYVGVRELAKELGMKGGNITYYFPTKYDLIRELGSRLSSGNEQIMKMYQDKSMYNYLLMHQELYNNQYKYRSLVISLPLLLKQNVDFRKQYNENQSVRKKDMYSELKSLFLAGYIQGTKIEILDMVLHSVIMMGRLWVIEANLDYEVIKKEEVISDYLKRLCNILRLVASEKGTADIDRFLNELQ
ncbi:MAG: TetR/AcrR family transcriptional regulator [Chitinophagaceae bacterium]|nr:TetR/AcrR family transcriptional regulator [Chitinophagaceae bacterium]